MKKDSIRDYKGNKIIINCITIIYFLILVKIILFKDVPFHSLHKISSVGFRSVNLIPFYSLVGMILDEGVSAIRAILNILGNMIIFIPMGIIFRIKKPHFSKKNILVLIVFVSILFEILQFILGLGSTDIDDIILNTLGGGLGAFFIRKVTFNLEGIKMLKRTILILVIMISGGILTIIAYDDSLLLPNLGTKYIEENIEVLNYGKEGTQDYFGDIIKYENNIMEIYLNPRYNENKKRINEENVSVSINDNTKIIVRKSQTEKSLFKPDIVKTSYSEIKNEELSNVINKYKDFTVRVWINNLVKDKTKLSNQILITIY